jgi:thiamine kinase-like enzyme
LFPGYLEYFDGLIPKESEIIIGHNDAQENNILLSLENNLDIMIIDFEYMGWQPRAYDLANYVNETMCDNSYPLRNGIAFYLENTMTDSEVERLASKYLDRYYKEYFTGDKSVISE